MSDSDRGNGGPGGAGFILGLLAGSVLGGALGILLAPKLDEELRGELEEQAKHLGEQARIFGVKVSEGYQKASKVATDLVDGDQSVVNHAGGEAVKGVAEDRLGLAWRSDTTTDVDGSSNNESTIDESDVLRSR